MLILKILKLAKYRSPVYNILWIVCIWVFLGQFSPEEDERKKRRRERNKIAAAKCRNKKKEKTECLQKVSDWLELFLICHPARIQTESTG